MNVSEKLRLVQGLHSHAEMFGFNWDDDSDWTWHDVACKIADEVDAENAKLREQVEQLHADQAHWELDNCPSCPNVADLQEALAENVKLRELVVEVFDCARRRESCETCKANNDGYACVYIMRELGVEVDK